MTITLISEIVQLALSLVQSQETGALQQDATVASTVLQIVRFIATSKVDDFLAFRTSHTLTRSESVWFVTCKSRKTECMVRI